jgi:hypothetical protein
MLGVAFEREALILIGDPARSTVRILVMNRAVAKGRSESLAEYVVRAKGNFLGGLRVVEISADGQISVLTGDPFGNQLPPL